MQLTPGQVREALQLSPDAYRHWKTVLLPLAARNGHKPCFSPGDLLALAIIKSLTDDLGIAVGTLAEVGRSLFEQCNQQPWVKFERLIATVEPRKGTVLFAPDSQATSIDRAMVVVPCAPIIATLHAALLAEQPIEQQGSLRFPLSAVTSDKLSMGGDKP